MKFLLFKRLTLKPYLKVNLKRWLIWCCRKFNRVLISVK